VRVALFFLASPLRSAPRVALTFDKEGFMFFTDADRPATITGRGLVRLVRGEGRGGWIAGLLAEIWAIVLGIRV
jgi:hypothetical protein